MAKTLKKKTIKKRVANKKRPKKSPVKKTAKRKPVKKKTTKRKVVKRKPTSKEIRAWVADQIHSAIAANQPEETADAYKAAAQHFGLSEKKIRNAENYIEP